MARFLKALIFDLDGTLVDSAPDLLIAVNAALAEEGGAALSMPELLPLLGEGVERLMADVVALRGLMRDGARERLCATFARVYGGAKAARFSRPYPGARAMLAAWRERGVGLAVCTNKPEAPARDVLERLELAEFFDAVLGGDSLPWRKPDPRHVLAAAQALGAGPDEAVMVGDHPHDIHAAEAAGVAALAVAWGYGPAGWAAGERLASFAGMEAALAGLGFAAVEAARAGQDVSLKSRGGTSA